ncbi:hypothetical protein [Raoultibacter phocaeensis]|uniref:hypothetical protein n=1 Tax=Raoultibacter phocaeensis TaxID=2479841 RepID=UPI0015D65829|nr:hypothetical protein [Raoultibacter phocaeensis]
MNIDAIRNMEMKMGDYQKRLKAEIDQIDSTRILEEIEEFILSIQSQNGLRMDEASDALQKRARDCTEEEEGN